MLQIDQLVVTVVPGGVCSVFGAVVLLKSVASRAKKSCRRGLHTININLRHISSVVMPQNRCKSITHMPRKVPAQVSCGHAKRPLYALGDFTAHLKAENERFCD